MIHSRILLLLRRDTTITGFINYEKELAEAVENLEQALLEKEMQLEVERDQNRAEIEKESALAKMGLQSFTQPLSQQIEGQYH